MDAGGWVAIHWPEAVGWQNRAEWAHFAVHLFFFATAILMWLPVFSPTPAIPRLSPPGRMLYLIANTVASAVPTPGGVGAIEAALVFVLVGAGVDDSVAWASVLLFRLVNYWFPTIPGYLGLRISDRRQLV